MKRHMTRFLTSLIVLGFTVGVLSNTVCAKQLESDENVQQKEQCEEKEQKQFIVSTNENMEKIAENITKEYDNVEVEVIESYDSDMTLIQVEGNGDLEGAIGEIQADASVEFVQPNYMVTCDDTVSETKPSDIYFPYQWGLENEGQLIGDYGVQGIDINVLQAWNYTEGRNDVIVGVLDSGIDINHEDLKDSIYINNNEISDNGIDDDNNGYIDDINGWDFLNGDNSVYDNPILELHGTFVAGILGAQKNGIGICGVAPNIKIIPMKFIEGQNGNTSDAILAIEYAKRMGVCIINCSWSGTEYNHALEKSMKKSGILFVCSSGNGGKNLDQQPAYPGCFKMKNLISVGAINNKGEYETFSNYGTKIAVAAPGTNVISTIPQNLYMFGTGTSYATPFVSGIAALVKSTVPNLNANKVRKLIINNVVEEQQLDGKVSSSGRVDAYQTIMDAISKE